MKNNTQVETAQKSQATNKIQPENVQKDLKNKSKVPTGKVTLIKETEARKKAREEQYRNFRINALTRRAKRMGYTDDQIKELIEKLKKQMDAPKQYTILVMLWHTRTLKKGEKQPVSLFEEAMKKENIHYNYRGDAYFSFTGGKDILDKLRAIAPPEAKIHIYALKEEPILKGVKPEGAKKPTNNTTAVKAESKKAAKIINLKRGTHKKHAGKAVAKMKKRKTLIERKKSLKAKITQLSTKNASTGSKTLKKAA